jgi:hypothetical protein
MKTDPALVSNLSHLDDLSSSTTKVMEASMACYKVITEQEEHFPMESLFSLVTQTTALDRKADRAVYDHVTGGVNIALDPVTGLDPIEESLATLQRRDTNTAQALGALIANAGVGVGVAGRTREKGDNKV